MLLITLKFFILHVLSERNLIKHFTYSKERKYWEFFPRSPPKLHFPPFENAGKSSLKGEPFCPDFFFAFFSFSLLCCIYIYIYMYRHASESVWGRVASPAFPLWVCYPVGTEFIHIQSCRLHPWTFPITGAEPILLYCAVGDACRLWVRPACSVTFLFMWIDLYPHTRAPSTEHAWVGSVWCQTGPPILWDSQQKADDCSWIVTYRRRECFK